jgi:hypothetical protein
VQSEMPKIYYNRHVPSQELALIRDALVACTGIKHEDSKWTCSAKNYRYIAPRVQDERTAPEASDIDAEPDFVACVAVDEGTETISRLYCKGSLIELKGSAGEFMERCLPDYRLRSELRVSGFSMGDVKVGLLSLGSQHLGMCLVIDSYDQEVEKSIIGSRFSPTEHQYVSEFLYSFIVDSS